MASGEPKHILRQKLQERFGAEVEDELLEECEYV